MRRQGKNLQLRRMPKTLLEKDYIKFHKKGVTYVKARKTFENIDCFCDYSIRFKWHIYKPCAAFPRMHQYRLRSLRIYSVIA